MTTFRLWAEARVPGETHPGRGSILMRSCAIFLSRPSQKDAIAFERPCREGSMSSLTPPASTSSRRRGKGPRTAWPLLGIAAFLASLGAVLAACPTLSAPFGQGMAGAFLTNRPTSEDLTVLRGFFSDAEMTQWKQYHSKKLLLHGIGLGAVAIFYLAFLLLGLNKHLKGLTRRILEGCSGRAGFRRMLIRYPLLTRLGSLPNRVYGSEEGISVLIYTILFVLLARIVFLPQSFLGSFLLEHREGVATIRPLLWFADYAKSLLVGTAVISCMVFGFYGLIHRVGKHWWLFVWAGVCVGILGYAYLAPFRAYLYSDFRPLPAGELRSQVEELARKQGLDSCEILVVNASVRTRKANAYVTGAGPTRRIVLYDTLVDQFTPREIVMILAHEFSHGADKSKGKDFLAFSITAFVVLAAAEFVLRRGHRIRRLHYNHPGDVAGLPVLFLVFLVAFEVLNPLHLASKRAAEIRADRKSLELVCDPEAFVSVHVKLARMNHSDVTPHPLAVLLYSSHPPFLQRIETARSAPCAAEKPPP